MIETKHILKLDVLNEEEKSSKYLSVITTGKTPKILLGTPGFVDQKHYEKKCERIAIMFSFPHRYLGIANHAIVVNKYDCLIIDKPPLTDRHKVTGIKVISKNLIEEIMCNIKEGKAVSYIVRNPKNQGKSIQGLERIINSFKYHSLFHYCGGRPIDLYEGLGDESITIFTFYSLKDCISIFNSKKVDGFGVSINNVSENEVITAGHIPTNKKYASMHILVSNYLDNTFEVDGHKINTIESIQKETFQTMAKTVSTVRMCKVKNKTNSVNEKGSSNKKDGFLNVIDTPSSYYGTGSTTSGYY